MKDRVLSSVRIFVRERQSTLASGLAALLIIVLGFAVFNYFSSFNKTKVPAVTQQATQTSQLSTNQGFPVNNSVQPPSQQQPASLGATNVTLPTTYTVVRGDNLSAIAQKFYGDGSKWTVIADANHLANPSVIHAGNVFTIPAVSAPSPTAQANTNTGASLGASTTTTIKSGSTYTVKSGDTLWDIAIQAYGSGYEWYRIDQANSPIARNANGKPLIVPGQTLRIP